MTKAASAHEIYRTQMSDAKLRILAVEQLLASSSPVTGLAALDLEFCFLQIRRIIECVTFGALVREQSRYASLREIEKTENHRDHGDPARDWQAPEILKRLVALSPHALPIPHKNPVEIAPGRFHFDRQNLEVNHSRLIELYKRAGGYLHARNPLSADFFEVVALERKKYEDAPEEVRRALAFLRALIWCHIAVNLESHGENDPRTPGSPQQAWLIDFGSDHSAHVGLTLAVGHGVLHADRHESWKA